MSIMEISDFIITYIIMSLSLIQSVVLKEKYRRITAVVKENCIQHITKNNTTYRKAQFRQQEIWK